MLTAMRKLDLTGWVYGLISAGVGGGSSAVTAAVSVTLLDPKDWGLAWSTVRLMGLVFAVSGISSMFFYLSKSPLPPLVEIQTSTTTRAVIAAADGTQVEQTKTVTSTTSKPDERKEVAQPVEQERRTVEPGEGGG